MGKQMGIKYTKQSFIEKLKTVRDDVELLGDYENIEKKTLFKCKNCGYEWYSRPTHILYSKRSCPNCTGRIKTPERFTKELEKINPDIEPLEKYEKNSKKILCRCKNCGYEWRVTPNNLLSKKCGCPLCAIKKVNLSNTLTNDEFLEEVKELKNKNIELLDLNYKGTNHKLEVKCNICGHHWLMTPSSIKQGYGCPRCRLSKLEDTIKLFLNEKNINYKWQVNNNTFEWLGRQSFDFYLEDYDIAIECQGEQHFRPVKYFGGVNRFVDTLQRDLNKKIICNINNKQLVYIIEKKFKKYITSNVMLEKIYSSSKILWIDNFSRQNLIKRVDIIKEAFNELIGSLD